MARIDWLESALAQAQGVLAEDEETEGFLMGRGLRERSIRDHGLGIWETPSEPLPNDAFGKQFAERYGDRGKYLQGRLIWPFRNGRGDLLGFEARKMEERKITQFYLPNSKWNPVFFGLNADTMQKIWAGGSIWLVEGGFDLGALERVVPEKDVVLGTVRPQLTFRQKVFFQRFLGPFAQVNFVFDRDEEGKKALNGWIDEAGKKKWGALSSLKGVGVRCRDVPYHGGKDPCEIYEMQGTPGLRKAFSSIL